MLHAHQCEVSVQSCEIFAQHQQLPSRFTCIPVNLELKVLATPSMAIKLVHYPLSIIWRAKVVCVYQCSVGKQGVVIGLMRPEQADMKLWVNLSPYEFTGELQRIVGGLRVCL